MAIQTVRDVEAKGAAPQLHPEPTIGRFLGLVLAAESTSQDYSTKVYPIGKYGKKIVISGGGGTFNAAVTWGGSIETLAPNEPIDFVFFNKGDVFEHFGWTAYEDQQKHLNFISCVASTLVNPILGAVAPFATVYYSTTELLPVTFCSIAYSNTAEGPYEAKFEASYKKLGRVRGRDGTPKAQAENRAFWLQQGLRGAVWLIGKLRQEASVDILDAAAALLRQMDKEVLAPIIAELQRKPNPELAEALLRALRRPHLIQDATENYSSLYSIIEDYIGDPAPEVRQAAYEVASKLPREDANQLLQEAQRQESDPELIEVIRELRQERSVGS
jgi:hypothetical protein